MRRSFTTHQPLFKRGCALSLKAVHVLTSLFFIMIEFSNYDFSWKLCFTKMQKRVVTMYTFDYIRPLFIDADDEWVDFFVFRYFVSKFLQSTR